MMRGVVHSHPQELIPLHKRIKILDLDKIPEFRIPVFTDILISTIMFATTTKFSAHTHLKTFQVLRIGFPKRP